MVATCVTPPRDSKDETVPQLNPLWRLRVFDLGTQGSWNVLGGDAGARWVECLRQGLEVEEWQGVVRFGQLLRESERSGGGGGRLDLRRETLRVTLREDVEEVLCFLFSQFSEEAVGIFSEHTELLSVGEGGEQPEDNGESTFEPSVEMLCVSCAVAFHSSLTWSL